MGKRKGIDTGVSSVGSRSWRSAERTFDASHGFLWGIRTALLGDTIGKVKDDGLRLRLGEAIVSELTGKPEPHLIPVSLL